MIHYYKFKNFYSFAEETLVDFRIKKNVPDGDVHSFVSPAGVRLAKVLAVVGANASGKTNLLKPLFFLRVFLVDSFRLDNIEIVDFSPHELKKSQNSYIEAQFEIQGDIYRYELELNLKRVLREALYKKTSTQFSNLFVKTWLPDMVNLDSKEQGGYDLKNRNFKVNQKDESWKRENASLIPIAALYKSEFAEQIHNFFSNFQSKNIHYIGSNFSSFRLAEFFDQSESIFLKLKTITTELDLGFKNLRIENRPYINNIGKDSNYTVLLVEHGSGKETFELEMHKESSGSQSTIHLLRYILPGLENGGVTIIDEFESKLHPALFQPMLDLLLRPRHNPNNTQMIFTTHHPEVINLLGKAYIYLVEREGINSEAWRLDDMSGVRKDVNLTGQYLAGAFGAIPRVAL
jgi:uncharacterized protein